MDKEILRNATLEIIRRSRIPTADDFVRLDKIKRFLFQSHELLNRNANLEGIVGNILEEALKLNAEQVYSWAEEQDAKTLISNILSMPESDKSSEIKVRLVRVYLRAARQNTSRTENDLVPWFRRLVLKEKANIGREALPTISELVRRESSVSENVLNLLLETAWIQHGKGIESNADILDYLIDTIIEIWPFLTNAQRQSFHRSIENISAAEFGDYKSSVNENRPPENTRDIDLERHRIFKSRLGKL